MNTLTRSMVLTALLAAPAARAEDPPRHRTREVTREVRQFFGGADGDRAFHVAWSAEAFDGKAPTKNAPYSANAITELEQTLGDGNRIHQKTTSRLFRDGQGRTRREVTLGGVGALAGGETAHLVFLQDPVAGTNYTLDPERKIARKLPPPRFEISRTDTVEEGDRAGKITRVEIESARGVRIEKSDGAKGTRVEIGDTFEAPLPPPDVLIGSPLPPLGALGLATGKLPAPKSEDLGTQIIEGVRAQGTRTTVTIPAGALGNERPLVTTSERWVSPELGITVMSKHSDPRVGTTTYRLTDLTRAEPDPALFQVPAGYTTREDPGRVFIQRRVGPAPAAAPER